MKLDMLTSADEENIWKPEEMESGSVLLPMVAQV
jgi:hypothetical protein